MASSQVPTPPIQTFKNPPLCCVDSPRSGIPENIHEPRAPPAPCSQTDWSKSGEPESSIDEKSRRLAIRQIEIITKGRGNNF